MLMYPTKLDMLSCMFIRQIGNTYAEIKGVENVENAILLVATKSHAEMTGLPPHKCMTLSEFPDKLVGKKCPIVVDHYVFQMLKDEHDRAYARMVSDLRYENTFLEEENRILKEKEVIPRPVVKSKIIRIADKIRNYLVKKL